MIHKRVSAQFFFDDALHVAPKMLGMKLVRRLDDGNIIRLHISDIEIYRGKEDLACHASKGNTDRTKIMFDKGGKIYVYLIYGMHWLLNFTTGESGSPQAILIRGTDKITGPGRIGRHLQLDKSFYGEDLSTSSRLWIEHGEKIDKTNVEKLPRVGVDYAGEYWAKILWRWRIKDNKRLSTKIDYLPTSSSNKKERSNI